MVSSTAAVIGSVIKVSRTGIVVVAAGADVSAVRMAAGRNWIASTSSAAPAATIATAEIVRSRMGMVIGDGRRR